MNIEYIYEKSEVYGEQDVYLPLINYTTYNNQIIDCECVEKITKESISIKTNKRISLYENINNNAIINGEYTTLGEDITIEKHLDSIIEDNTFKSGIFKLDSGKYYRVVVFEDTPNTTDTWAIINIKNDEIWDGKGNAPDEFIKDWCNNNTSEKYIRLKDINPYSLTYGKIIEQLKCQ